MTEVILAIAMLCQVSGNSFGDYSGGRTDPGYDSTKSLQNNCHAKLLKCVSEYSSTKAVSTALHICVEKGNY